MKATQVISLVLWIALCFRSSVAIPTSHQIANVPYHRQENNFACGASSLEMVIHYYGEDVKQQMIMNVARTSPTEGTLSLDMIRSAHFSALSSSIGTLEPTDAVEAGYPSHPVGYGAFSHHGEPWLDTLKELVSMDIPVIVLVNFKPTSVSEGHYRVVIGYDDEKEEITMLDPWDRNGWPTLVRFSYSDFLITWSYKEKSFSQSKPYFGVAISPWRFVDINVKQINGSKDQEDVLLTAKVTYPCHSIFRCFDFPADNSVVLVRPSSPSVEILSSQSLNIGVVKGGTSHEVQWSLRCRGRCQGNKVSLKASGIIRGSVPAIFPYHSGYEYVDAIGGEASFTL